MKGNGTIRLPSDYRYPCGTRTTDVGRPVDLSYISRAPVRDMSPMVRIGKMGTIRGIRLG